MYSRVGIVMSIRNCQKLESSNLSRKILSREIGRALLGSELRFDVSGLGPHVMRQDGS